MFTAHSWIGDVGTAAQKVARDAAYAMTTVVENLMRSNNTLGVTTVLWTGFGGEELVQNQDENGARAWVSFTISFRARI